ncbi:MAG: hypothetical protein WBC96_13385, partial [Thermodesulfobacteriota bacterium]
EPFLHTINPNTGATISTTEMTLEGRTVRGCNGMAKHPQTNVCYVMLNITPDPDAGPTPPRILATIDQNTGVTTAIGAADRTFATIAFTADGTLYGVTGDGGSTPETLFTIDPDTGATSFVMALGNGSDGEAIAYNFNNNLMYHTSGIDTINVDNIFESINLGNNSISPITISGDTSNWDEQTALVQLSANTFLTAQRGDEALHSITTSGVVTQIGEMDHVSKGLAFDCGGTVDIPTMSEWGLITTVLGLGLVSFFVLRRRSAFQK